MISQNQIDRELSKIKQWYWLSWPLCLFCAHEVREGDLAHLIRRSESRVLQTEKLNCGIAHRHCHDIFDNDYLGAVYLPRITECLYIIWLLSPDYFNLIVPHFDQLSDAIAQFPDVPYRDVQHHGQILQLNYLYQ